MARTDKPSVVLFDLGGVLAHFDPSPRLIALGTRCGLAPEEVQRRLEHDGFWAALDRGLYPSPKWQSEIRQRLGEPLSDAELLTLNAHAFELNAEVVEIARRVSERMTTGLLTNNGQLLHDGFEEHLAPLHTLLSPLLFSYQFGYVKPDPKLYEAVGVALGVTSESIMLIDDREENVREAKTRGWHAIRFHSPELLRRALEARGLFD